MLRFRHTCYSVSILPPQQNTGLRVAVGPHSPSVMISVKNVPFVYLNTWSPAGDAVLGVVGNSGRQDVDGTVAS